MTVTIDDFFQGHAAALYASHLIRHRNETHAVSGRKRCLGHDFRRDDQSVPATHDDPIQSDPRFGAPPMVDIQSDDEERAARPAVGRSREEWVADVTQLLHRDEIKASGEPIHPFRTRVHEAIARIQSAEGTTLVAELSGTLRLQMMWHALRTLIRDPEKPTEVIQWTACQEEAFHWSFAMRFEFIYGTDDYHRYKIDIHRFWGLPEYIPRYFYLEMIRRYGKSKYLYVFSAVNLYYCPGDRQIALAIGSRITKNSMKEYIKPAFMDLPNASSMINQSNMEVLNVRSLGAGLYEYSEVISLPMTGAKRGLNALLVILDEAAYGDDNQLLNDILPQLQRGRCAFIAASSPAESAAHATKAWDRMKEKGTGRPLFKVIRLRMMCDACQDTKGVDACPHAHLLDPPYERPSWISRQDQDNLREMYKNNLAALRREIYGLQESTNTPVIPRAAVGKFFSQARYKWRHNDMQKLFFISVDPGGGTTGSNSGVVSLAYDDKGVAVVGLNCPYGFQRVRYRVRNSHTKWRWVGKRVSRINHITGSSSSLVLDDSAPRPLLMRALARWALRWATDSPITGSATANAPRSSGVISSATNRWMARMLTSWDVRTQWAKKVSSQTKLMNNTAWTVSTCSR